MTFSYAEEIGFLILTINGEIRVNSILELKKELQTLINDTDHIAIDLEKVDYIDSSGVSLLINMHKRLSAQNRLFCIFNHQGEVGKLFSETNLGKVVKLYPTKQEFVQDNVKTIVDELYPPPGYTFSDKLYHLKNLKCILCNSEEIKGFVLNKRTQEIHFDGENMVPAYAGREGNNTLDVYAMELTICPKCYFASRHISYFSDLKGEFKSILTEKEIHTLVKEDGNRARMLKGTAMTSVDKFYPPFSPKEAFWVYTLAEECAHTLYRLENRLATYDLAHYNAILTLFSGAEEQQKFLRKAYMWYGEIFKNRDKFAPGTVLETLYFLTVISEKLKRQRDGEIYLAELKALNTSLPDYKKYLKAATTFLVAK